ncbi:hypothetical protein ASPWEDRAFT_461557 [Aspergillus wentii DTO 134E9]|uniref:Uncharacterized protein n=1 Tax=Aspergillus wentii DTO 134E9 TaxID=1073089 RepID=A0A1L9RRW7_ASPWE|nr:uncharacterized protein ASPWEDRAFT_461557 [Aspergillus wentii DTO 134E9]OJJ37613.1 hypothetical protein ASPWEDRAFT_461557 [Aspergillus wentii DTO 134E9]
MFTLFAFGFLSANPVSGCRTRVLLWDVNLDLGMIKEDKKTKEKKKKDENETFVPFFGVERWKGVFLVFIVCVCIAYGVDAFLQPLDAVLSMKDILLMKSSLLLIYCLHRIYCSLFPPVEASELYAIEVGIVVLDVYIQAKCSTR